MSANPDARAHEYLVIPRAYCNDLGGLRWSMQGDAVEMATERTFAMVGQIAEFIVGFGRDRPLIHFGYILHLLSMLEISPSIYPETTPLAQAFRANNRDFRNAGALCAELCRDVDALSSPPKCEDIFVALTKMGKGRRALTDLARREARRSLSPALSPQDFQERVLDALRDWKGEDIEHWLRHGRGPADSAGRRIAEALDAKPPTLESVLGSIAKRDRIAGALRFEPTLNGALTLPPRRRNSAETLQGGYSDISTRGSFERILPSQLVLDPLELLRRLADNELLHYEPEQPQAILKEELVVLLDQGWRVWGDVRLALTAALLALGRFASRSGRLLRIATTSWERGSYCPIEIDPKILGERLEATQLRSQPGLLLGRLIAEAGSGRRDIVILAHPFTLDEPTMRDAIKAGVADPRLRLFGLTVDSQGQVELSELLGGFARSLRRLRVDFRPEVEPKRRVEDASATMGWSGDVEPIGYPFRYWMSPIADDLQFDFDEAGERLVVAGSLGRLQIWKLGGGETEVPPRAMFRGRPLCRISKIQGVADGFVVFGQTETKDSAIAHYRFSSRRCVTRDIDDPSLSPYSPNADSALVDDYVVAVRQAFRGLMTHLSQRVALDPQAGSVDVCAKSRWPRFTPTIEGEPCLKGAAIKEWACQENVLAFAVQPVAGSPLGATPHLLMHRRVGDEVLCLVELPELAPQPHYRFSIDGSKLARRGSKGIEAFDIRRPDRPDFVTPMTPCPLPQVSFTEASLAIDIGEFRHLFLRRYRFWSYAHVRLESSGPDFLMLASIDSDPLAPEVWPPSVVRSKLFHVVDLQNRARCVADSQRFQQVGARNVNAVVDGFGQVLLLGSGPEPKVLAHLAAMPGRFEFRLPTVGDSASSWSGGCVYPEHADSQKLLRALGEKLDEAFGFRPYPQGPPFEVRRAQP